MGKDAQQIVSAHIAKYREAIDSAEHFQLWFNRAADEAEAAANGHWDFAIHIATPEVRFHLGDTSKKTALEIGYGGGRMLAAAGRFFGGVVGVDIHNRKSDVHDFLSMHGIHKATLLDGDGETIPMREGTVDFVYSFIVLHHLQSFAAFESYVRESFRVLKKGGLAHLYYGESEKVIESQEYKANQTSLMIPSNTAIGVAENAGFSLLSQGQSWRFGESSLRRGLQRSMLLIKR